MPITQEQFEEIQEVANALESAFNDFDQALRSLDRNLYERWKAYGKQISNEYVSMGPCMSQVMESLESDIGDDEEGMTEDQIAMANEAAYDPEID